MMVSSLADLDGNEKVARSRKNKRSDRSQEILKNVKAQRGLDRKRHFEEGRTLVAWMGGPRLIQKNKRKYRRPKHGSRDCRM